MIHNTLKPNYKPKSGFKYKWFQFYEFICLLRVEPYLFVFIFVASLKKVPTDQLIQDKICLFTYQLDTTYCTQLSTMSDDEDTIHMKSIILKDCSNFTLYSTLMMTIPTLITTLFIGAWTDTYVQAKKILLLASAVAAILEAIILIFNDYFFNSCETTLFYKTHGYSL